MRLPKRGERGFTLIELLIVVAILGVLAAVVIPNVTQFFGAGEEEAKDTELANIQAAVSAMMVDNQIATLPNPVTDAYDMHAFPDISDIGTDPLTQKATDPDGNPYTTTPADQPGYYLYQHDIHGGDGYPPGVPTAAPLVNYVATQYTAYYYTVNASGTVTQGDKAPPPP